VAAAAGAHPELVRRPRHAGAWVAHFHVVPTALTANLEVGVGHAGILAQSVSWDYDDVVIPAIVLAAGKSVRMGRLKAMLPIDDRDTFLTRIVRTFGEAGVTDVTVVLGYQAPVLVERLRHAELAPRVVVNERFETGQLSSLLAGLNAVDGPEVEAVLLMLVDAPLVSPQTVRAVCERFRETHAPIVRPVRGDAHGHPVLIARSLFQALRQADPTRGAKPVVRGHVSSAGDVEVQDPGAFMDLDTPEEYERVFGRRHAG
jgi:molybdenum cofactor cytidylyltransferase